MLFRSWKSILTGLDHLLRRGIDLFKGGFGTRSMPRNNGKIKSTFLRTVRYAASPIERPFLVGANTVIKIVKRQPSVEEEVYNLTTKFGMYFANGVLVSNSLDSLRYIFVSYKGTKSKVVDLPKQWESKDWKIGI